MGEANLNSAVGGAPYSPAVMVNASDALLFVSGQLPVDVKTGRIEVESVLDQTRVAMMNALDVGRSHGACVGDVVKVGVFTTRLDESAAINEGYLGMLGEHRPARSLVEVSSLPRQALVEIDMVVCIHHQSTGSVLE